LLFLSIPAKPPLTKKEPNPCRPYQKPDPLTLACEYQISGFLILLPRTPTQTKEEDMAEGNGSSSTAIVAIFVILVIAVGAYFLFFANTGGGGGGANIIIPIVTP
jgi:hypothetical protein